MRPLLEIELLRFTSGLEIKNIRGKPASEIIEITESSLDLPIFYAVDWVSEGITGRWSLGNFQAWFCNDRVLVRLDEHREHYATSPNSSASPDNEIEFEDWTGTFIIPAQLSTGHLCPAAPSAEILKGYFPYGLAAKRAVFWVCDDSRTRPFPA